MMGWTESNSLQFVEFFRDSSAGLASLFFPFHCHYCGAEGVRSCRDCLSLWREPPSIRLISSVPIYSVVPYDQRATHVVMAAKERGEKGAKELLIAALDAILERIDGSSATKDLLVIVPIPSSKRALRKRGEDFIHQLIQARGEGLHHDRIHLLNVLRWSREVRDQSQLSLAERVTNLAGALTVDEQSVAKWRSVKRIDTSRVLRIVIVDDVLTSGSTMAAAISAISHSSLGFGSQLLGATACHSAKPL